MYKFQLNIINWLSDFNIINWLSDFLRRRTPMCSRGKFLLLCSISRPSRVIQGSSAVPTILLIYIKSLTSTFKRQAFKTLSLYFFYIRSSQLSSFSNVSKRLPFILARAE